MTRSVLSHCRSRQAGFAQAWNSFSVNSYGSNFSTLSSEPLKNGSLPFDSKMAWGQTLRTEVAAAARNRISQHLVAFDPEFYDFIPVPESANCAQWTDRKQDGPAKCALRRSSVNFSIGGIWAKNALEFSKEGP